MIRLADPAGLEPSRLCLEITETGLMDDDGEGTAHLHSLKRLGGAHRHR